MSDTGPRHDPPQTPGPATPPSGEGAAVGLDAPRGPGKIPRKFGRYRIQDCLGHGGMGAVFRAHDTQLDRAVALKVPFLRDDEPGTRERFYREARAAAALHHANICPVFDVGELHGVPYLTMAYIDGRSLADALAKGQPFAPRQAAALVRKLALAMQEAHARGVIHRDLKPANVLLRADGEPVITDFGLARRGDDPGAGMTRQGDILGTVEYMSPEQFEGDNAAVGPASDVYALGVVLYELLTGRRPFEGGAASKVAAILLKPPTPPGELRPGLSPQLDEICLRAMAKRPADRYPTMAAFAAALTAYLRSPGPAPTPGAADPTSARPTPPPSAVTRPVRPAAAPPQPAVGGDPGWELVEDPPPAPPPKSRTPVRPRIVRRRKRSWARGDRPIILGAAAFAAACLTLIAVALIRGPGGDHPTAPPPSPPSERAPAQPAPHHPRPPAQDRR